MSPKVTISWIAIAGKWSTFCSKLIPNLCLRSNVLGSLLLDLTFQFSILITWATEGTQDTPGDQDSTRATLYVMNEKVVWSATDHRFKIGTAHFICLWNAVKGVRAISKVAERTSILVDDRCKRRDVKQPKLSEMPENNIIVRSRGNRQFISPQMSNNYRENSLTCLSNRHQ